MSIANTDKQFTPFVVIFQARSGSTYLIDSLNSHPQIDAHFEVLVENAKKIRKGKLKPNNQLEFVDRLLSKPPNSHNIVAVGFKTKLKEIVEKSRFADLLRKKQAKIICLTRKNLIKQTVSLLRAVKLNQETGDWNLYEPENKPKALKIDLDDCRIWLKQLEDEKQRIFNYVDSLRLPSLYLSYEDLLEKKDITFERIFSFLKVEPQMLNASCFKNTSDNLSQEILNFDEVRSYYVGTPYEEMFDEVLVTNA